MSSLHLQREFQIFLLLCFFRSTNRLLNTHADIQGFDEFAEFVNIFCLTFCLYSVIKVTFHPRIFRVITVTFSPASMWTSCKRALISRAVDVIKPYWPIASTTKNCPVCKVKSSWVSQHSTHYVRIIHVPMILAYCSPLAIVVKWNTTLIWVTTTIQQLNI